MLFEVKISKIIHNQWCIYARMYGQCLQYCDICTYYNFVFIPDFDHEKLVKLLQQIWVMKFSVVALLPNLNSTNKRTFRSFVTGAHVEKYLWNHPYITSAKGLGGWGQKIDYFRWRPVLFLLTLGLVVGSKKVQKCADVI